MLIDDAEDEKKDEHLEVDVLVETSVFEQFAFLVEDEVDHLETEAILRVSQKDEMVDYECVITDDDEVELQHVI